MKHIQTFEAFINEAYKQVPYNKKVTGTYEVTCGSKKYEVRVAGFERENDDSDALYLMDDDAMKSDWGGILVKNAIMPKLERGGVHNAIISKTKETCKIRRIADI